MKNQEDAANVGNTILMSSQGFVDLVGCKNGKDLYWTTDINAELPIIEPKDPVR